MASVITVGGDSTTTTAIERFSIDGSETPEPSDDMSTRTREPGDAHLPTIDRPETARAAAYLRTRLSLVPGFVAGLLLAGHDGELVLYSQWHPTGEPPERIPDEWSTAPALEGITRVDARTYAVDFTAPKTLSEVSSATPHAHFGVFTVTPDTPDTPDTQEELLAAARTHAPDSIGTPGLEAINFHRSLDGRRVVNLGLWTGFAEFGELLSRPGFTDGGKYWGELAGFRPHYFDVAAITTRDQVTA